VQGVHQLTFVKMGNNEVNAHYICVNCKRQFIDYYDQKGYTQDIKSDGRSTNKEPAVITFVDG
jgi:hypothetical protein